MAIFSALKGVTGNRGGNIWEAPVGAILGVGGGDRHPADGRERQVGGHQRLAGRRQLPQKTEPDAGRLLGVVFEAVVPLGVVEPDLEHGVAANVSRSPPDELVQVTASACK